MKTTTSILLGAALIALVLFFNQPAQYALSSSGGLLFRMDTINGKIEMCQLQAARGDYILECKKMPLRAWGVSKELNALPLE